MSADDDVRPLQRRHLRLGWWWLFAFGLMGLLLETLHGFKVGFYLDGGNASRRLMWTLAHAHGVLLGLVNVAFAVTLGVGGVERPRGRVLASQLLVGASVFLPGGFFLGGLVVHGGDPGLGVLVVPLGAVLLAGATFLTARLVGSSDR